MSTALPALASTESTFMAVRRLSMVSTNCPVYWKAPASGRICREEDKPIVAGEALKRLGFSVRVLDVNLATEPEVFTVYVFPLLPEPLRPWLDQVRMTPCAHPVEKLPLLELDLL